MYHASSGNPVYHHIVQVLVEFYLYHHIPELTVEKRDGVVSELELIQMHYNK